MAKPTAAQIAEVKAKGFLHNRGTECFSGRAITENGVLTAAQLKNLAECAEKYGNGTVTFTTRLTVEMPGIHFDDIPAVQAHVAQEGMMTGGTGAKVRPVVACKGTTCVYGNFDTQALAKEIHDRYFMGWSEVRLPHKFKIAVGGCPNSCLKPSLNDFGIEGHSPLVVDMDKCRHCKRCLVAERCPMKAVQVTDGAPVRDEAICTTCGVCTRTCPFGAYSSQGDALYRIFIGGTWGKKTRMGTALSRLVTHEEIFPLLEKTMLWFKENAYQKERLGAAIDRIGVDKLEEALFADDLLERKEAILAAPILQRG